MILSILDGSLLIPIKHLLIFYIIFALLYGLMRAFDEWKVLVETGKFRLYKDIIYDSKKIKISIIVVMTLIFAILLPLFVINDIIKAFKEGIEDFNKTNEEGGKK